MTTRTARVLLTTATAVLASALAATSTYATPVPPAADDARTGLPEGRATMGGVETDAARPSAPNLALAKPTGIDVSGWQGNVNWASYWDAGRRFAYVKATEGVGFQNEYFAQQYVGSYNVGMIRGAYHFARPDGEGGAAQADYFVEHGGAWSGDGKTLPGVLDMEWNPYDTSKPCWGKSASQLVTWIRDFTARYKQRTSRDAVIYTTTSWWKQCTGNTSAFGSTNPLWIARYASAPGELPAGWGFHTFWQYTDNPIDHNSFNGEMTQLRRLATG